jgi:hypothetical protein
LDPLLVSVSEHVFSVAKTSVYFLVFPKNEPLVLLVSFQRDRWRARAGSVGRVTASLSPAVHGMWQGVPTAAGAAAG